MVNIQFCCIIWIVENHVVFDKHNLHQGHCVFGSVCRHVCHHSVSKHKKQKKSPKIKKRPYIILHLISDLSFKVNRLSEGNNNAV